MSEELHQDPKINRNTDMNLSAYLMCCGFEFLGIELPGDNEMEKYADKITFMFEYSLVMKQKKEEYFAWKSLVEPKKFSNARRFLNRKIKEMQAERQGV